MSTASIGPIGQQGQQTTTGRDAFREVNLDDFLKLMITELQNQDPLDPMGNSEILQQISQIREIESNQRLVNTLEAVFLGQNMTTASGMIGKWIMKLSEGDAVELVGQVERVSIEEGVPKLSVGNQIIDLKHVSNMQILSDSLGQEMDGIMDMVGKTIRATTDGTALLPSQEVTGRVYEISMVGGVPKYHVGDHFIDPRNLIEVLSETILDTENQGN